MGDHNEQQYFHSFVLYSDDDGSTWTMGELLPKGFTECQVAELQNGSLLLTSRLYGAPWLHPDHPPTDLRRAFVTPGAQIAATTTSSRVNCDREPVQPFAVSVFRCPQN